ncbi:hypothetical protein GWG65_21330 [Bradyrhizobium sp. CSA207]|nr:hypothetical protein [Bradyrhizobium sp. CSA207]
MGRGHVSSECCQQFETAGQISGKGNHRTAAAEAAILPERGIHTDIVICRASALHRHCEELLRRSNPDYLLEGRLDCFATLAMTGMELRPTNKGRLTRRAKQWQKTIIA